MFSLLAEYFGTYAVMLCYVFVSVMSATGFVGFSRQSIDLVCFETWLYHSCLEAKGAAYVNPPKRNPTNIFPSYRC